MSTKSTIRYRHSDKGVPGFHLYNDLMEGFGDDIEGEMPVYLRLDRVAVVELATLGDGGASVTLRLTRELAGTLGLLSPEALLVPIPPPDT